MTKGNDNNQSHCSRIQPSTLGLKQGFGMKETVQSSPQHDRKHVWQQVQALSAQLQQLKSQLKNENRWDTLTSDTTSERGSRSARLFHGHDYEPSSFASSSAIESAIHNIPAHVSASPRHSYSSSSAFMRDCGSTSIQPPSGAFEPFYSQSHRSSFPHTANASWEAIDDYASESNPSNRKVFSSDHTTHPVSSPNLLGQLQTVQYPQESISNVILPASTTVSYSAHKYPGDSKFYAPPGEDEEATIDLTLFLENLNAALQPNPPTQQIPDALDRGNTTEVSEAFLKKVEFVLSSGTSGSHPIKSVDPVPSPVLGSNSVASCLEQPSFIHSKRSIRDHDEETQITAASTFTATRDSDRPFIAQNTIYIPKIEYESMLLQDTSPESTFVASSELKPKSSPLHSLTSTSRIPAAQMLSLGEPECATSLSISFASHEYLRRHGLLDQESLHGEAVEKELVNLKIPSKKTSSNMHPDISEVQENASLAILDDQRIANLPKLSPGGRGFTTR